MDLKIIDDDNQYLGITIAAVVAFIMTVYLLMTRMTTGTDRTKTLTALPDEVLVHEITRRGAIPSFSPFALKLETYLRMAKIPYRVDNGNVMSKKGKVPWIEIDGEEVADSTFCIEYLCRKFNVQLDEKLSKVDKAIARSICKMTEENTFWATLIQDRFINNVDEFMQLCEAPLIQRIVVKWYYVPRLKKFMYGHGIGRHSKEEIRYVGQQDLNALSTILGTQPFFFGNNPTSVDATIFGLLANISYGMPEEAPPRLLIKNDLKNLDEFIERMRNKFWPDWDDIVSGKAVNKNVFATVS